MVGNWASGAILPRSQEVRL